MTTKEIVEAILYICPDSYKSFRAAHVINDTDRNWIAKEHNEYVLSKQMLRSGTSIGAMMREAKFAQSRADFINKASIRRNKFKKII